MATWTGDRSPVSRIDQAVFVLQIVTTLADAVTFIPGLKMAAVLAQNVANIAKVHDFIPLLFAWHLSQLPDSQE